MFTDLCNVQNKSLHSISQGLQCSSLDSSSSWDQLPNAPLHVPPAISKSLFSLCNGNPLPTFWSRTSSFTQNRRTEYRYPIPFPCRFSISSLESNFYLCYLEDFYGMFVLFLFPFERTSPNIHSVQSVLTCTGRAPHWAPEMSWYSTSSSVSIFTLYCKSLSCFVLWALPMLRE